MTINVFINTPVILDFFLSVVGLITKQLIIVKFHYLIFVTDYCIIYVEVI